MLIAETEYRYQVEEDIKPFRDVLLGLFFITVGMALDLAVVLANFGWVAAPASIVPVLAKLVLIVALARAVRRAAGHVAAHRASISRRPASSRSSCWRSPLQNDIVPRDLLQPVLAAMIISMLHGAARHPVRRADRAQADRQRLARARGAGDADRGADAWRGRTTSSSAATAAAGRTSRACSKREDIPYVAMDSDPERVREAAADGSSVVYGDASRREALVSAGLAKARAVAITFANTPVALKILHHVQQQRPELPVIVRTVDDSEIDKLLEAGATEVVPEVLEGSLMLASHSLLLLGVPLNRVLKRIRTIREERYGLFRGFFHGATDAADAADNLQARLHTGRAARSCVGGRPHARRDRARRATSKSPACAAAARARSGPTPDWRFEAGDVVVLLGRPEALVVAEQKLLSG